MKKYFHSFAKWISLTVIDIENNSIIIATKMLSYISCTIIISIVNSLMTTNLKNNEWLVVVEAQKLPYREKL